MPDETSVTKRRDEERTESVSPVEPDRLLAKEEELVALRKQNEDLLTRLKYLQADFENYKKRAARESEAVTKFAHELLLARILPVLDGFDAAMAHLDGQAAEGVRMVHENLRKVLQEVGLQEIPAEGQPFDPYLHDCVQQVADPEGTDGIVKEVVRKGYRVYERVLRPAQVIVVKNGGENHG